MQAAEKPPAEEGLVIAILRETGKGNTPDRSLPGVGVKMPATRCKSFSRTPARETPTAANLTPRDSQCIRENEGNEHLGNNLPEESMPGPGVDAGGLDELEVAGSPTPLGVVCGG